MRINENWEEMNVVAIWIVILASWVAVLFFQVGIYAGKRLTLLDQDTSKASELSPWMTYSKIVHVVCFILHAGFIIAGGFIMASIV
jgi:hypothetical protein